MKLRITISLFAYVALWLISVFNSVVPVIGDALGKMLTQQNRIDLHWPIVIGGGVTAIHMLYVYVSFHEIETEPESWKPGSRWVTSGLEKLTRGFIFLSMLFIGGELCLASFAAPLHDNLRFIDYMCRPHVGWEDIVHVQTVAKDGENCEVALEEVRRELDKRVPNTVLDVSPPPPVSWCIVVFVLLCVWDVGDHFGRIRPSGPGVEDAIKRAVGERKRVMLSDVFGLTFWVLIGAYFVCENEWRDMILTVLMVFLWAFLSLYFYQIVLRRGSSFLRNGFRVMPQVSRDTLQ